MPMEPIDFLMQPSPERIKKEIQNICDSYSHPWDILAELSQNSVDAIRAAASKKALLDHTISIKLDARDRSIEFYDSGIGLPGDKVVDLLAPHGTNKTDEGFALIGQKGVGLTYVIFNCDEFNLESCFDNKIVQAVVKNAASWKKTGYGTPPSLSREVMDAKDARSFTRISLRNIEKIYDDEYDMFYQTTDVLIYLLRTKTAIGSTAPIFSQKTVVPAVTLTHIDKHGHETKRDVPFKYFLPEEFLGKSACIDVAEIKANAGSWSDKQKEAKLRGKCLRVHDSEVRAGRTIRYYGFFVPSRDSWKEISSKNNLARKFGAEEDYLVTGGINVATRGMPTGIELTPPASGNAGYWPNCFFLLEDDSLSFDLGRKSIPGRTQDLLKRIAREQFNELTKFVSYVSGSPTVTGKSTTVLSYKKSQQFDELKKLPNLGIKDFPYLKHPDSQEAAVVAIFHELVAKGLLRGYQTLRMGYKATYDLWGIYQARKENTGKSYHADSSVIGADLPIIIEFKFSAESILEDFEINKYFADIDLIICWDFDEKKLAKENVIVNKLGQEDALFMGSNYELAFGASYSLGGASTKPMIALRHFIEGMK